MNCRVEKENEKLKKRIAELEQQHRDDIDRMRELLTNGDENAIYRANLGRIDDK